MYLWVLDTPLSRHTSCAPLAKAKSPWEGSPDPHEVYIYSTTRTLGKWCLSVFISDKQFEKKNVLFKAKRHVMKNKRIIDDIYRVYIADVLKALPLSQMLIYLSCASDSLILI